jgi:hypothetical protein
MAIIGRRNTLSIERASGPGLYLNGGVLGEILLPGRYIPPDLAPGVKLDVFIRFLTPGILLLDNTNYAPGGG